MKQRNRIRLNLAAVNVAILLNFSACSGMQGLQSSLNQSAGTLSLSAFCVSLILSALFLPAVFISTIGERRSMAIGTLLYSVFTIANCFARPYTLITGAIAMGCGAAILWSAVRGYVRSMSVAYALIEEDDKDAVTRHSFGVLMTFSSTSLLVGNIMSSLTFQSISMTQKGNSSSANIHNFTTNQMLWNSTNSSTSEMFSCGMHNCDDNSQTHLHKESPHRVVVDSPLLYILFGAFAAIQILSALILFLVLTDPADDNKRKQSFKYDEKKTTDSLNADKLTMKQTIAKQILSTAKFNAFDDVARLLIPITIDIGVVDGFVVGQLTRDWMTCYMGIQYVGYGMGAFGIGSMVASYVTGTLSGAISRQTILLVVLAMEIATFFHLLLWEPNMTTDSWVFYVIFAVYGIISSCRRTLINATYTIFFPSDKEAANSSTNIWIAVGAAVAFASSSAICNLTYAILMLTTAVAGTFMYVIAERIRKKRQEAKKDPPTMKFEITSVSESAKFGPCEEDGHRTS